MLFLRSSENGFKNQNFKIMLQGDTEGTFNGNISNFGKNWNKIQLIKREKVKVKFEENGAKMREKY